MTTFDEITPKLDALFTQHRDVAAYFPIIINRDLNSRVRLIVDEKWEQDPPAKKLLKALAQDMERELGSHAFPPDQAILFDADLVGLTANKSAVALEHHPNVQLIDRLATEGDWSNIAQPTSGAPRIVFYSIKGGVGRSTALAAAAWALAEDGRRVLVMDLDLESPGLSASLLPEDRRPTFGVTDWLVEDLVDNGDAVFDAMTSMSPLSSSGEIIVAPAHGADPGAYIAKLGRVWMPKTETTTRRREIWPQRLHRLLDALEQRHHPDIILIDARAGIDEVASACLADLGATLILLFALDGDQTWGGYEILFEHWRKTNVAVNIRERLQCVGAMLPETGTQEYFEKITEKSWELFCDIYDATPAGQPASDDLWSFSIDDENAPHYPWAIRWHRGFFAVQNLHQHIGQNSIDTDLVNNTFSPLLKGLRAEIDDNGEAL